MTSGLAIAVGVLEFGNETVAFPWNGLYEVGQIGVFLQRGADLANRRVDAVFGVNENVFAPQAIDDFLPGDDVAVFFCQQDEQLHGNPLDLQGSTIASQLIASAIQLEFAELAGG